MAIDRSGNAFAVGYGSSVFYSPLSSGYTKWTSISPSSKLRYKTKRSNIEDYSVLLSNRVGLKGSCYFDDGVY